MNGGNTVEGTATLSGAAPAAGTTVSLSSDSPAARVPSSIAVPPGASSATFIIETAAVASDTTVTILASSSGVNRSATLRVMASDDGDSGNGQAPLVLDVHHDELIGGDDTVGTIALANPAPPGGLRLELDSDDPAVDVPSTETIPAGATSGKFEIRTQPVTSVRTVTIVVAGEVPAARGAAATVALEARLEIRLLPTNGPPTITGLTDQIIDEDTSTGPLTFTIGDAETPADSLTVSGRSSNPGLVPDANIVFGSSGASRTVTVTPAADWSGSTTITVTVSDGVATATGTFTVTVNQLFDDSETFSFTGGPQTFHVPAGVTSIQIEAYGAEGGDGDSEGGDGGSVTATVAVTPSESLAIFVGGQGGTPAGGFNGGASGGDGPGLDGGGGGGASDVRRGGTGLADRIVVAGGGGGGGAGPGGAPLTGGTGGAGGGLVALAGGGGTGGGGGGGAGGGGGTQAAGGAGGAGSDGGDAGSPGTSGNGGTGGGNAIDEGGGGGGGYFGGGGGGEDDNAEGGGGGGGGSSFAIATATDVTHEQGVRTGNGLVIIRW